jgi:hypothetical protein
MPDLAGRRLGRIHLIETSRNNSTHFCGLLVTYALKNGATSTGS